MALSGPVASWQGDGRARIAFPATRISESLDQRIIPRARPYLKGEKVDGTGPNARRWEIESLFHNGLVDPETPEVLYPGQADALCEDLYIGEIGTLTLTTRGEVRAKLQNYRRTETADQPDCCAITTTWVEDNEEDTTAASFTAPSARAVAVPLAAETVDALEQAGCWDGNVAQLAEAAASLEQLAGAPGEYAGDVEQAVLAVAHHAQAVERAFSDAAKSGKDDGRALLLQPESNRAVRLLRKLADVAHSALARSPAGKRIAIRRYPDEISIFDVATIEGQDAAVLLAMNPAIGDPLAIPPRTPVRVLQQGG